MAQRRSWPSRPPVPADRRAAASAGPLSRSSRQPRVALSERLDEAAGSLIESHGVVEVGGFGTRRACRDLDSETIFSSGRGLDRLKQRIRNSTAAIVGTRHQCGYAALRLITFEVVDDLVARHGNHLACDIGDKDTAVAASEQSREPRTDARGGGLVPELCQQSSDRLRVSGCSSPNPS
jgi:hypothetical protein